MSFAIILLLCLSTVVNGFVSAPSRAALWRGPKTAALLQRNRPNSRSIQRKLCALTGVQDFDDPRPEPSGPIRHRSVAGIAKDPNAPLLLTMHETVAARKAQLVTVLDISSLTDIAAFMVIVKSNNRLHNRAIAYHIDVSSLQAFYKEKRRITLNFKLQCIFDSCLFTARTREATRAPRLRRGQKQRLGRYGYRYIFT